MPVELFFEINCNFYSYYDLKLIQKKLPKCFGQLLHQCKQRILYRSITIAIIIVGHESQDKKPGIFFEDFLFYSFLLQPTSMLSYPLQAGKKLEYFFVPNLPLQQKQNSHFFILCFETHLKQI